MKNGDLVNYFQANALLSEKDLKVFFKKIVLGV